MTTRTTLAADMIEKTDCARERRVVRMRETNRRRSNQKLPIYTQDWRRQQKLVERVRRQFSVVSPNLGPSLHHYFFKSNRFSLWIFLGIVITHKRCRQDSRLAIPRHLNGESFEVAVSPPIHKILPR